MSDFYTPYKYIDGVREMIASGAIYRGRVKVEELKSALQKDFDWMIDQLTKSIEWHDTEYLAVSRGQVRDIIAQELNARDHSEDRYDPTWPPIRKEGPKVPIKITGWNPFDDHG